MQEPAVKSRLTLSIVALALVSLQATAQTTIILDKAHTQVKFTVSHLVISEVDGMFKDFDVTFVTGAPDFSDAKLGATVKVASVSTDNEERDRRLRAADFFDVDKYPLMTFTSTSFRKTGDNTFKINGDLTIRDVTRAVVLDAVYKGEAKAWGKTIVAFSAHTEINRFDFGISWAAKLETGPFIVGDKVKINLNYEGVKQ
jgi:polyisoprenoid-binding protein YceI